jgi:hypothetical protein
MGRASEELLAQIHGEVGAAIKELIQSPDPRERLKGIEMGMKFLKDNSITATVQANTSLHDIRQAMPTADDLERLMTMTPD